MRHTAVLVLGCLLVAVVVACGGGPSEADTESILSNAKKAMAELQSYKLDMEIVTKASGAPLRSGRLLTSSGYFQVPDRLHMTSSVPDGMVSEVIEIGDKHYDLEDYLAKGKVATEWAVSEARTINHINLMVEMVLSGPTTAEPMLKEIDGIPVYYIVLELSGNSEIKAFLQSFGDSYDAGTSEIFRLEGWINIDSFYVREITLSTGGSLSVKADGSTADLLATVKYTFSAFNEDFPPIVAP